jgi:putative transposase
MAKTCPERFHGGDLRKGRVSEPGRIYLITAVTRNRAQVFSDLSHARVLVNTMRAEERRQRARTLSFVVMPDHICIGCWNWVNGRRFQPS